jgi:hypothetical protein
MDFTHVSERGQPVCGRCVRWVGASDILKKSTR